MSCSCVSEEMICWKREEVSQNESGGGTRLEYANPAADAGLGMAFASVVAGSKTVPEFHRALAPGVTLAAGGKFLLSASLSRHDLRVLIRQTDWVQSCQDRRYFRHLALMRCPPPPGTRPNRLTRRFTICREGVWQTSPGLAKDHHILRREYLFVQVSVI